MLVVCTDGNKGRLCASVSGPVVWECGAAQTLWAVTVLSTPLHKRPWHLRITFNKFPPPLFHFLPSSSPGVRQAVHLQPRLLPLPGVRASGAGASPVVPYRPLPLRHPQAGGQLVCLWAAVAGVRFLAGCSTRAVRVWRRQQHSQVLSSQLLAVLLTTACTTEGVCSQRLAIASSLLLQLRAIHGPGYDPGPKPAEERLDQHSKPAAPVFALLHWRDPCPSLMDRTSGFDVGMAGNGPGGELCMCRQHFPDPNIPICHGLQALTATTTARQASGCMIHDSRCTAPLITPAMGWPMTGTGLGRFLPASRMLDVQAEEPTLVKLVHECHVQTCAWSSMGIHRIMGA